VHRFEIVRGELDFSRNLGFNPELDIEGRRGRAGERVYITLTGSAAQPQIAFSSDRMDESDDEIQQALLGTGGDVEAAATLGANYAEQVLRDLSLIEELSIDPAQRQGAAAAASTSAFGGYGYNVSGGRPIGNRLFVLYTQGFYSDIEQRVAVEYDINQRLLLEAAYERRSVTEAGAGQSQNAFGLQLKYRHEY
jgi:autotransporter translocation and assembly factor TamB